MLDQAAQLGRDRADHMAWHPAVLLIAACRGWKLSRNTSAPRLDQPRGWSHGFGTGRPSVDRILVNLVGVVGVSPSGVVVWGGGHEIGAE